MQDQSDLYDWYERNAERMQGMAEHEAGVCGDDCSWCAQERYHEDAYDRARDDALTD